MLMAKSAVTPSPTYLSGPTHQPTKAPLAAALLKRAAGVESGSAEPNREKVGRVTREQLREIATMKMADLNANTVEQAMKIIEGTARSMGIEVVG